MFFAYPGALPVTQWAWRTVNVLWLPTLSQQTLGRLWHHLQRFSLKATNVYQSSSHSNTYLSPSPSLHFTLLSPALITFRTPLITITTNKINYFSHSVGPCTVPKLQFNQLKGIFDKRRDGGGFHKGFFSISVFSYRTQLPYSTASTQKQGYSEVG